MTPEFKESNPEFPYRYNCSFSPIFRTFVNLLGADMRPAVESVIMDFEANEELCKSLKVYQPHDMIMRGVDLKDDYGKILAKCFVWWDWTNKSWVVFMEGAEENYWEKGQIDVAAN